MEEGLSLPELLISIGVCCLLGMLAVPMAAHTLQQHALNQHCQQLLQDITYARQHAVSYSTATAIAPKQTNCWACGWRIFTDTNRNAILDEGEHLLIDRPANLSQIHTTATLNRGLIYQPSGHALTSTGAFAAGTFTLSNEGNNMAKQLIINRAGRVRFRAL